MKKVKSVLPVILTVLILASLVLGVVGCNNTSSTTLPTTSTASSTIPTSTSTPATTSTTSAAAVLTLKTATQTKTFTLAELKALPVFTGSAGQMSSTGNISGPGQYKGVKMMDLLALVGGITETNGVRVSAKDGYSMTLSYNQLTTGNFTVLDSTNGKEIPNPTMQPIVFIAYELDGKPISDDVGPLRLGIMTQNNSVTEGHWWIKWASMIEVIAVELPWTLVLDGAIKENIDQSTFESCSAVGCHGAKWTDDQNRVWNGVPLWNLVGKVDDVPLAGQGDDFRDDLADKGYTVHLTAKDGFTLNLTSAEVKRNSNLIVAFHRDNAALPENQWPLRLVGPGMDKSKMVGQIVSIKVIFDAAPSSTTTSTTSTAAGPAALTVVNGTKTKTYTLDQIKAMTPATGYAGSKNKAGTITAPASYKGVLLTELLKDVGGLTMGNSVKVTASDGFTKTYTCQQVLKGEALAVYDITGSAAAAPATPFTFLLAYEAKGTALDAATGPLQVVIITGQDRITDNSNFSKMVVKIEIIPEGTETTTPSATTTKTNTTTTSSATTAAGTVVLTVKGTSTKTYTMDQLKTMTPVSGYAGSKKGTTLTAPAPYKGVALADLLTAVGGIKSTDSVKLTASDGYTKTLTYAQVTGTGFTYYDLTGNAAAPAVPGAVIVAYEMNGQAIDAAAGPLQVLVLTGQNQLTDTSNFAKMVVSIEIVPAA